MFPDDYEPIVSVPVKKKIAAAFADFVEDPTAPLDDQLATIRAVLAVDHGEDFTFYDAMVRNEWQSSQQIPIDSSVNMIHLGFSLPPGVAAAAARCYERKSSKTCFLIHYHFRIRFDPATQPGFVYVSASTNRFTSSQVPFEVTRPEDRLAIHWSTLGLIRGYDPHISSAPEIEGCVT